MQPLSKHKPIFLFQFFPFLFLCVTRISCICSGLAYGRVSSACFGNYNSTSLIYGFSLELQATDTICPTTTTWVGMLAWLSKQTHTSATDKTLRRRGRYDNNVLSIMIE
ncbi:hypothetical protein F4678DRAFT_271148 [Xylaria arbuscula]|nr:hypothetical protein F4678DRAFT_271148 [Xylaria arbuscula]